jgi:hypothetical protein
MQCPRAFTARSGLAWHEKSHTGEKNYHCRACDRAFKDSSMLRKHERTHDRAPHTDAQGRRRAPVHSPAAASAAGQPGADSAASKAAKVLEGMSTAPHPAAANSSVTTQGMPSFMQPSQQHLDAGHMGSMHSLPFQAPQHPLGLGMMVAQTPGIQIMGMPSMLLQHLSMPLQQQLQHAYGGMAQGVSSFPQQAPFLGGGGSGMQQGQFPMMPPMMHPQFSSLMAPTAQLQMPPAPTPVLTATGSNGLGGGGGGSGNGLSLGQQQAAGMARYFHPLELFAMNQVQPGDGGGGGVVGVEGMEAGEGMMGAPPHPMQFVHNHYPQYPTLAQIFASVQGGDHPPSSTNG